jgi:hypothetical protein
MLMPLIREECNWMSHVEFTLCQIETLRAARKTGAFSPNARFALSAGYYPGHVRRKLAPQSVARIQSVWTGRFLDEVWTEHTVPKNHMTACAVFTRAAAWRMHPLGSHIDVSKRNANPEILQILFRAAADPLRRGPWSSRASISQTKDVPCQEKSLQTRRLQKRAWPVTMPPTTARSGKTPVAKAPESTPVTPKTFSEGCLSSSTARALRRCLCPQNEDHRTH